MSETIILNKTFKDKNSSQSVHVRPSSIGGNLSILGNTAFTIPDILPKKIEKEVEVEIAANLQYQRISFLTMPQSSEGCITEIVEQPPLGATGKVKVKVAYTIPPSGSLVARLRVYAKALPQSASDPDTLETKELHLINNQSVERLEGYMFARKRIALVISGSDALKIIGTGLLTNDVWKVEKGPIGPRVKINPTWEVVAIIALLAGAAVSALAILCFATIIFMAIAHNYNISVKKAEAGSVKVGDLVVETSFPSIVIDLEPA